MKRAIYTTTYFFILLGISNLFAGCCWLGLTCYELGLYGEPRIQNADVYLDGRLVKSSFTDGDLLDIPYGRHEIKVVQKGYKPFVAILNYKGGRSEKALQVTFKPLDSPEPQDTLHQGDVDS